MKNRKLRADLILIGSLLLLSGLLWLALNLGRREGGEVVVRVDGVITERHSLSADGRFPLNGGSNILVIRDGQAWLSEANCPDLPGDHLPAQPGDGHRGGRRIRRSGSGGGMR